jgi:dolichyldiphosphatase
MPSSHANSLAFLTTFVALTAAAGARPLGSLQAIALIFAIPSVGIFLAWLRVALGYHTLPQVVVGWLVGSGIAAWWSRLGAQTVLPLLAERPSLEVGLFGVTSVAVAFFVWVNMRMCGLWRAGRASGSVKEMATRAEDQRGTD